MKVQRRCNPKEVYEVLNESPTHYIIDRGYNDIALRKADYEPVQEWVDVTQYCNLLEDAYGRYSLFHHTRGIRADDPLYLVTRQSGSYKVEVKR